MGAIHWIESGVIEIAGQKAYNIGMRILICQNCKKEFSPKNRVWKQKFCSKSCAGRCNKSLTIWRKGQQPWNKGLKGYNANIIRSKEWGDKISKANKGDKASNWQGGISSKNEIVRKSREHIDWRKAVFARDDYKCVIGGAEHGKELEADHIEPFALNEKLRFDISNGRTLCKKCHRETKTYGISKMYQRDYTQQKAIKL